jgi:hypothetical protein
VRSQRCRFFGPIILLLTLCGGAIAQGDKDVGAEDSIRTGVIRGQVVDENGQTLESVSVFIRSFRLESALARRRGAQVPFLNIN